LYHPNYELDWVLKTDASDFAVGYVLIQLVKSQDNTTVQQVIAFGSKKFSDPATRWSTIEKECYGVFFAVYKLQYYLTMKKFILLTDHNNLLWMHTSVVPKIIRMRIFLQGFDFQMAHIPGKENVFADYLSREEIGSTVALLSFLTVVDTGDELVSDEDVADDGTSGVLMEQDQYITTVDQAIKMVHNSRMGHSGVRRTWKALNQYIPGHGISIMQVKNFVDECVWCQKLRLTMADSLLAPVRSIRSDHPRVYCGYDTLYVTPADAEGYQYIHVFKLLPSRLVGLYPAKDLSSEGLASAMFQFFVTYGIVEVLITDPGSNIDSAVVTLLLQWFGVRLRMSIVGRHQSNGVERTNKEILRFISGIVHCERLAHCWSKPQVISTVQFLLNEALNNETGLSPFEYVFGSVDSKYLVLPNASDVSTKTSQYMKALNDNLKIIREEARVITEREQEKRLVNGAGENSYQKGDLVFRRVEKMVDRTSKLQPQHLGPYEVVSVNKSDVQCRHLVTAAIGTYHMERLKPCFASSREDAYEAAMVDYNQFVVKKILSYSGDPEVRSTMQFVVEFEDGSVVSLPYVKDLFETVQFEEFVRQEKPLTPLLYTLVVWKRMLKESYNKVIGVQPGDCCFVDLRAWGSDYFQGLLLPAGFRYVVGCTYIRWEGKGRRRIVLRCLLLCKSDFAWDAFTVYAYGMQFVLTDIMVLVDKKFCEKYPAVLHG
jgi:hypothetical protein